MLILTSVKLHEFQDLKEIYASYSSEDSSGNHFKYYYVHIIIIICEFLYTVGSFNNAQWTNDGQLLSISLKNGQFMCTYFYIIV